MAPSTEETVRESAPNMHVIIIDLKEHNWQNQPGFDTIFRDMDNGALVTRYPPPPEEEEGGLCVHAGVFSTICLYRAFPDIIRVALQASIHPFI